MNAFIAILVGGAIAFAYGLYLKRIDARPRRAR